MNKKERAVTEQAFQNAAAAAAREHYVLRLYVTGTTAKSVNAIRTIKRICEERLKGHYELEVIDLYQQPNLAKGDQIVAVPTLVKKLPAPMRKLIGDLANEKRVLLGLNLRPRSTAKNSTYKPLAS